MPAETPSGHETILIVEDDTLVRNYVDGLIRSLGYKTIVAEDGPSALAILQRQQAIDLLFTDIVMPHGMSGRDLAEQAAVLRPALKVLFTSGYAENALVHHGRLDPGVQLIAKPYHRRDLALKLRAVLDATVAVSA